MQALYETPASEQTTESQLDEFLRAQFKPFVAPVDPGWKKRIASLQRALLKKVFLRGIPDQIYAAKPRVRWGRVLRPDPSYLIRKLCYEAYPNYWIPALLYEPTKLTGNVPVIINPNGHHRGGKAADYKQIRCANIARRGMIALNIEYIGMGDLEADARHNNIALLDLTGMAGVGLFYLALKKGLDLLLSRPHADRKRVCCTGLSGGGWQTIVLSAIDPRITLSVPVAGYTATRTRIGCPDDLGDMEQTPSDLCTVADYDMMTAMLAPRPALLILNQNDECCFKTATTRPVIYDAVLPTYKAMGAAEVFETYNNIHPGTHNYAADNRRQFYRFVKRHFKLAANMPEGDMHRTDELYTEDDLRVELPATQTTVERLAWERADALRRRHKMPRTVAQKKAMRKKLAAVLRLPHYPTELSTVRAERGVELLAVKAGPWTLALTAEPGEDGHEPVLIMGDAGRATPMPMPVAEEGPRYRIDTLGCGTGSASALSLMVLDATGHRFTGIRVAQLLAAARAILKRVKMKKLHLVSDGWNASFICLLAAALEPEIFSTYTSYGSFPTLRYLMDWGMNYEQAQSFFCFGLMEVADVPQIRALMEGVTYRQPGRGVIPDRR